MAANTSSVISFVEESPVGQGRVDLAVAQLRGGVRPESDTLFKLDALLRGIQELVSGLGAAVEAEVLARSEGDASAVATVLGGVAADGNTLAKLFSLIGDLGGAIQTRATPEDFAALAYDRGGALVTTGSANNYVVQTQGRRTTFGAGLALLVKVNRSNTGPAYLAADGMDPRPWLDREGQTFPDGALRPGHYVWAIADPTRDAWISDLFGGLTVALFDAVQRAWWLSLPDDPRGIGPNAPWRNGGTLGWTAPDNPTFTLDSPEGRRLTLKLLFEALPTDPRGIGPGEPWNNGGTLAVTEGDNPFFTSDSLAGRRLALKQFREALPTSPDGLDPGEPWLNGETIAFVPAP